MKISYYFFLFCSVKSPVQVAASTSKPKITESISQGKLHFTEAMKDKEVTKKSVLKLAVQEEDPVHKKYRMDLYNKLMKLRSDIAHEKDCMPYMVISNTALMSMSKLRPKSMEDLKTQACKF